jgi:hypothetical protein
VDNSIVIATKTLPESVLKLLKEVGFNKKDIVVKAVETVCLMQAGGDGRRSFVGFAMLDGSREPHVYYGSWGGANPFEERAPDLDNSHHNMILGSATLLGYEGGGHPTHATLYVHPDNIVPLLPAKTELSDRLCGILGQWTSYTSAGRKDEWNRSPESKPTDDELELLIAKGLLKRNSAGAVSITTEGKNYAKH